MHVCACMCVVEDVAEINVWVSCICGPSGLRLKPCQTQTEVSWAVILLSFPFTLSTSSNKTVTFFSDWNIFQTVLIQPPLDWGHVQCYSLFLKGRYIVCSQLPLIGHFNMYTK